MGRRGVFAWLADKQGGAAVEFGILAPLMTLVLAGLIDLGSVVFVKFRLDSAVAAGANYALVRSDSVNASDAIGLATTIAAIVTDGGTSTSATVVVNGGPTVTVSQGAFAASGAAGSADSCFCPTVASGAVSWGSAVSCGSACPTGGLAGKFVQISVARSHAALFSGYSIVTNGAITTHTIVQTQ